MVKKRAKGVRIELEAKKMLIEEGYLVEKKNTSRWQSDDFYGLFDLLAIGQGVRLIQVKSHISDFYKARRAIGLWMDANKITGVSFEVWLREPRKAWRCEKIKSQDAL